jgi:flagellar motor switch/type III secretory pathway protein FliN
MHSLRRHHEPFPILLYRFWSRFCSLPYRMATAPPLPTPVSKLPQEANRAGAGEIAAEQALVPLPNAPEEGDPGAFSGPVARLPVELDVAVPVREFRVRNLLALEPGQVIETQWAHGEDMPLAAGEVQLAWSEFEVVDAELAVRVTRLA